MVEALGFEKEQVNVNDFNVKRGEVLYLRLFLCAFTISSRDEENPNI